MQEQSVNLGRITTADFFFVAVQHLQIQGRGGGGGGGGGGLGEACSTVVTENSYDDTFQLLHS